MNLFIFVYLTVISASWGSDVLEYSGLDFNERIKEHELALVEFFAPWCGHCQRLAPKYESAATTLKNNDPPIPLVKVDCTSDGGKDTCSRHKVSGYPTLKVFRNGEFSTEYDGPREEDDIVKHMLLQVGPSSKEADTEEAVENALNGKDHVIFGFFKQKGTKLTKEFLKIADKFRGKASFMHSYKPEIIEKYGTSDKIVLFQPKHLHNKFEESKLEYEGSPDSKSIEQFIKEKKGGLVGHRTKDNQDQFKTPLFVAYYAVDYEKNAKTTNYWRNRILKVARNYSDQLNFAISDNDEYSDEMTEYGFDTDSEEPLVRIQDKKNEKYRMSDAFSIANMETFIQNFLAGKLKPYRKSEPIPDSNDDPVKVAVADNFEEVVTQSEKDVLIEFYAPWCGHCRALAPTYEKLGETMKDEDVEIVKFNAVDNDVPSPYVAQGFPTIYWVPKKNKNSPVKYEGGRELNDFIKYISEHATDELKGYNRKGKKKSKEAKPEEKAKKEEL